MLILLLVLQFSWLVENSPNRVAVRSCLHEHSEDVPDYASKQSLRRLQVAVVRFFRGLGLPRHRAECFLFETTTSLETCTVPQDDPCSLEADVSVAES
jgi:hypothetical protein